MRETIARGLLVAARLIGVAAVLVDAKTVQQESEREIRKVLSQGTFMHEAQHSIKLDNETIEHIGQYL